MIFWPGASSYSATMDQMRMCGVRVSSRYRNHRVEFSRPICTGMTADTEAPGLIFPPGKHLRSKPGITSNDRHELPRRVDPGSEDTPAHPLETRFEIRSGDIDKERPQLSLTVMVRNPPLLLAGPYQQQNDASSHQAHLPGP